MAWGYHLCQSIYYVGNHLHQSINDIEQSRAQNQLLMCQSHAQSNQWRGAITCANLSMAWGNCLHQSVNDLGQSPAQINQWCRAITCANLSMTWGNHLLQWRVNHLRKSIKNVGNHLGQSINYMGQPATSINQCHGAITCANQSMMWAITFAINQNDMGQSPAQNQLLMYVSITWNQ